MPFTQHPGFNAPPRFAWHSHLSHFYMASVHPGLITTAALLAAVSAHLNPGAWVSACVHQLCLWAAGVYWRAVFPSAKRHGYLFRSLSCLHRNTILALLVPLASGSPLEGHQGCFESYNSHNCKECRVCLLDCIQLAFSVSELGRLA